MSLWSRLERRIGDLAGELVLDEYRAQLERARAVLVAGGAPAAGSAERAEFLEKPGAARRELGHFVGEVARAAANLDQPLLVTVMGEFSSGKSSFVNAFIGADVAPVAHDVDRRR